MKNLLGTDEQGEQKLFEQMRLTGFEQTKDVYHRYVKYVGRNEAECVHSGIIELKECIVLVSYIISKQLLNNELEIIIYCQDGRSYTVTINQF